MVEKVSFRFPRDSAGHGSHTASTTAGCYVTNMNYKELPAGGARGDGVQILSLSQCLWDPDAPQGDYFNDAISIGSFHAVSRGILVVASVGNEGNQGSATTLAPWMLSIAASSADRDFTSDIVLGNSANFTGESRVFLE
ncbi:hypothetical protein QYF36_020718 [Acer negundo]|nr:hypothetical protein QYF36_020718 [Acer negundo]